MRKLLVSMTVVFMLVLSFVSASQIDRSFNNSAAYPNDLINVTLTILIDQGESYYVIDETYNSNFVLVDAGDFTIGSGTAAGHLLFVNSNTTQDPRTSASYVVRAPTTLGSYTFSGEYVLENITGPLVTRTIGGETSVIIQQYCVDQDVDGFNVSYPDLGICGVEAWDCNDAVNAIHPGATELAYDGIDNDCSIFTPDDDLDSDGYNVTGTSIADCDDTNASINPGATEIPYDGVDNDCAELVSGLSYDPTPDDDVDSDTYLLVDDCSLVNNWDNPALHAEASTVHPLATEIANDGIDQNCDGVDLIDVDLDGYSPPLDCNDYNASIRPGVQEVPDDGVDNNCDGYYAQSPVLNPIGDRFVNESQLLSFTVSATDGNGESLTLTMTGTPVGAAFTDHTDGTATFSWTPGFSSSGVYPVTVRVSDGTYEDSESFSIVVGNVNRPPVMSAIGSRSGSENNLLTFTATATDPDGDPLSFSIGNAPTGSSFTDHGDGTATFSWTPGFTMNGTYPNVIVSVSDGQGNVDSESITITIFDTNQLPVLSTIGDRSYSEGVVINFTISATDADGDSLTYIIGNKPANAVFTPSTRNFYWATTYSDAGVYSNIVFTVNDGKGGEDQEAISITIGDVNRPPVLTPIGSRTISEGNLLIISLDGSDPDNDPLIFDVSGNPIGSVLNQTTDTFTWQTGYSDSGNYLITFSVSDGSLSDSEVVTVTVGNVNRPPVLNLIGDKDVNDSDTLNFTISASDPDGDTLTYSMSGAGVVAGMNFNVLTRRLVWTPTQAQVGQHTPIIFTVDDGHGNTDSESITITVGDVNHRPNLAPIGDRYYNVSDLVEIYLSATDADNDVLTYSAIGLSENATLTGNLLNWTPQNPDVYDITFIVTDTYGASDSENVTFSVGIPNRAPTFTSLGDHVLPYNTLLNFTVSATDPDGDFITYTVPSVPSGATFVGNRFTWTPTLSQVGEHYVQFTATDDGSPVMSRNSTILINVTLACSDGTLYDTCAAIRPQYCSNGTIINNAPVCQCPSGQVVSGMSCVVPTTTTDSGSSGGGGGGGGGGSGFAPQQTTNVVNKTYQTDINRVEVVLTNAVVSPTVYVKSLIDAPVIKPQGKVYKYFDIERSGFENSNIQNARMTFSVAKTWVSQNKIDLETIHMVHFNGVAWEGLQTRKTTENAAYLFYDVTVSGFSPFAIVANELVSTSTSTTPVNQNTDSTDSITDSTVDETSQETVQRASISTFQVLLYALFAMLFLGGLVALVIRSVHHKPMDQYAKQAAVQMTKDADTKDIKKLEQHLAVELEEGKTVVDLKHELEGLGWNDYIVNTIIQGAKSDEEKIASIMKYVEYHVQKGESKDRIKQTLVAAGWTEELVDEVFKEISH